MGSDEEDDEDEDWSLPDDLHHHHYGRSDEEEDDEASYRSSRGGEGALRYHHPHIALMARPYVNVASLLTPWHIQAVLCDSLTPSHPTGRKTHTPSLSLSLFFTLLQRADDTEMLPA